MTNDTTSDETDSTHGDTGSAENRESGKPDPKSTPPAITQDDVRKMIEDAVRTTILPGVNRAITSHLERQQKKQAAPPEESVKGESEIQSLRKAMTKLQEERAAEMEARVVAERDAGLRRAIDQVGVVNAEAVFRFVKPDLKVGDGGEYYATGQNGDYIGLDQFMRETVRANKWMQSASGRGGSGGSGDPSGGNSGAASMTMDQYKDKLRALKDDTAGRNRLISDATTGKFKIIS